MCIWNFKNFPGGYTPDPQGRGGVWRMLRKTEAPQFSNLSFLNPARYGAAICFLFGFLLIPSLSSTFLVFFRRNLQHVFLLFHNKMLMKQPNLAHLRSKCITSSSPVAMMLLAIEAILAYLKQQFSFIDNSAILCSNVRAIARNFVQKFTKMLLRLWFYPRSPCRYVCAVVNFSLKMPC